MDWSNGGAAATDMMPDGQSPAPPTAPTIMSIYCNTPTNLADTLAPPNGRAV